MPEFSSLNTRNGTYSVSVPDAFTEKRVNRVLEMAREYYSKLDRVLDSINSHIHFAGMRGRFSYKGSVVADLDESGNLKAYATTKIYYNTVEIVMRRNLLGSKTEITVEEIEEPREVLVALNFLLRGMRVSGTDISIISSTLLAVATVTEGLGQEFRPSLIITTHRASKIISGEYSASFKVISDGEIILQKGDFTGEHIEGVRDYYLKALSLIVADLVARGKFSTEALYGLLSYYADNRRFLNVFYLRGYITSLDVKKARAKYKWTDTAYEVLVGSVSFPLKKALTIKWPKIEEVKVETPVEKPVKPVRPASAPRVGKTTRKSTGTVRKVAPENENERQLRVGDGGNILLKADEIERELLEGGAEKSPPGDARPVRPSGRPVRKAGEKGRVVVDMKDREPKRGQPAPDEEPASLDNWKIPVRTQPVNPLKELLRIAGERPSDFSRIGAWLKRLSEACTPYDGFTGKLCGGLDGLETASVKELYGNLSELVKELEPLAENNDERTILSTLREALRVVEVEYRRLKREEARRKIIEMRNRKLAKEFEEAVKRLLTSAVRVMGTLVWEKPGVKPLSRLLKTVKVAKERLDKTGSGIGAKYSPVVEALEKFVEELSEALTVYPKVPPSDYKKIRAVSPELEGEYEEFIKRLEGLKETLSPLKGFDAFKEKAEKLEAKIDKVISKFSVAKGRVKSKVRRRVNEEILDAHVRLSRVKVSPPLTIKTGNKEALELAKKVRDGLKKLMGEVSRSRLKDRDELVKVIDNTVKSVELFISAVEKINALPVLSNAEKSSEGVRRAVELLKSLPNEPMFKSVRRALRKYIRIAGRKAHGKGAGIDLDGIRISINFDRCVECPEIIARLEEALRNGNLDAGTRKRIKATLKAVKLIDEYPLVLVNSLKKKPDKFARFKGRVLSVKEVDEYVPPGVRSILKYYYEAVGGEEKSTNRNGRLSVRTKIQSIKILPPVRKRSYGDVREKINELREEVSRLVESGELDEKTGEFYLRQLGEIEKVIDVFEKYPMDNAELHKKGVEELKKADTGILPSRVRRAVEGYTKAGKKGKSVGDKNAYLKVVKLVRGLTPDDIVNLRYERINAIVSIMSKYSASSGKVAKIQSDLEVLSKVLKEALDKGVRKLLTVSSAVNTSALTVKRLKENPSRITEERLSAVYVKLLNTRRDLEVLKKTLEVVRDVLTEMDVISKVSEAIGVVDKEIERVDGLLSEVERLARENLNYKAFEESVARREEKASEKATMLKRLLVSLTNTVLKLLGVEDEELPTSVEKYPDHVRRELSKINTLKAFDGLESITPLVGKLRVMMRKYEEETGREFPLRDRVEALTKFALTIDELASEVSMTPAEIISFVSSAVRVSKIPPKNLRILAGKRNIRLAIGRLEEVIEGGERIVSAMRDVIKYSKKHGQNPVPMKRLAELEGAVKKAENVKEHLEKALNVGFAGVKIDIDLDVRIRKSVELKTGKAVKSAIAGEKRVEKKAVSLTEKLKIELDETLPETIKSTDVAKKINAFQSVAKLKVILKGIVTNVREHNKLVEIARKEYERYGFFSVGTLSRLKRTATRVKTSCEVYIKNANAVMEELERKAREHEERTRQKAVESKLKQYGKDGAGALKKAFIIATTSGEEVHVDGLLDEISTASELVERVMNRAERVVREVERLEKDEAVRTNQQNTLTTEKPKKKADTPPL